MINQEPTTSRNAGRFLVPLVGLLLSCLATQSHAQAPVGNCSSEESLDGRSDIVMCEPWESSDWWQNGYLRDPRKVNPIPAQSGDVSSTEIVSTNCISGKCLKVDMALYQTGSLSLHWPTSEAGMAPQQMYLRYYIKLGPDFDANQCSTDGSYAGDGGKFPGLGDTRTAEQCGNGGNPADGLNCWSMRANFRNCYSSDGNACSTKPGAVTRIGSYLYHYQQPAPYGSAAHWDEDDWGQTGFNCGSPNDVFCGIGDGGVLVPDRWYRVEMFVRMNTPSEADGEIRAWVDGTLSYEKTNMIFRLDDHDNLHVRTIWLNVFKGGVNGNCVASEVYLDQMVAATNAAIGEWNGTPVVRPNSPESLQEITPAQ